MPKKLRNGYYDEKHQSYVFYSVYDYPKFEKELQAHFADGGLNKKSVIAGVLGVSTQTISNWMNPKHSNYRDEFHALVDRLAPKADAKTDLKHRDLAYGRMRHGNAAAMNRRVSHILGMNEKVETKQEVKGEYQYAEMSYEELKEEIARLDEEIETATAEVKKEES